MPLFKDLGLEENLLSAVEDLGFIEPTPIQEECIPSLQQGDRDCIALAQTGTGKTAAFGLPLLQLINPMSPATQAIIIAPTRELCMQIQSDLEDFAKYEKDIRIVAVYGGADARDQKRKLNQGAQVICATPGRLIDFIQRGDIDLESVERIVLDEADEMLNMGFLDDIKYILNNAVNRESLWLFSATMPSAINKIAKSYMNKPIEIAVNRVNSTNEDITHEYYLTSATKRYAALKRILDFNPEIFGVVFARTKRDTKKIADKLRDEGYACDALHGDMVQKERDVVMNRFREGKIQILVATDVAARGIDVADITHVINYELPEDPEVYTHRSGRTGRAGKKGTCISLLNKRELSKIRQIEKICKTPFQSMPIPHVEEVMEKQISHAADKFISSSSSATHQLQPHMGKLMDKLEHLDREELIMKVFSELLKDKLHQQDLHEDLNESATSNVKATGDRQSIFINVGSKDGFTVPSFKQWVSDYTDIPEHLIYRVHMKEMISFFDVESKLAPEILTILNKQKHNNRKLRVDLSERNGSSKRNYSSKKSFTPGRKAKYKYSKN